MASILLLAGCVTLRDSRSEGEERPTPPAKDVVDGIETWDLAQRPRAADVGLDGTSRVQIHETREPRTIRLLLPEEATVTFEARLLTVQLLSGTDDEEFTVSARGATVEADALTTQLRDLMQQLGLPVDAVDAFREEIAAAPPDQTERIRFSSPAATFGELMMGVQANLSPIAGGGRFQLGVTWS
ncbi:hypothetical protein ACT3SP_01300 [Brachybacterium sp. AOP43-C2-M15]|uniref:hypothetical protein n=1 Tax=Brachybacterium sp. AOP43-C2-M15 TaxID=3457661 RepID=UPI0040332034